MMSNVRNGFALAFLAVLFPVAALADVSGTATVNAGQSFSLDNGAAASAGGGDITFTGSSLTYVGSAKGGSLALLGSGAAAYASLTSAELTALAALATTAPIALGSLPVNTIVGVATNGGNPAKLLITASSASAITFQYTTFISVVPIITGVLNNYSLISPGLPNSGIAPGTLFIIQGSTLASATSVSSLQNSAAGLPTTLNGASIAVTVNGTTVHPAMYYAEAKQIAAVLPSSTPTGTATVTVTYSGAASNAFSFTVVPTALGLGTYTSGGYNVGIATDAISGALITFTNSAKPGEILVFWGSGAGADTADSDTTQTGTPHAVSPTYTFYIGGSAATPSYQGSSGYPGLNQINVTVPANAPTGCGVSIIGQSGNIVTNSIALPISATGGVCNDPVLGYNGTQLQGGGTTTSGTYTTASVILEQSTSPQQGEQTIGIASFMRYSGGTTTVSGGGGSVLSLGGCIISNSNVTISGTPPTSTGLDAGTITLTGPAGSQVLAAFNNPLTNQPLVGTYDSMLSNSFIPAGGGAFTITGSGGKDVGSFTSSMSMGPLFQWTNQSADSTVTRASGIPVTWSGGTSGTYVYIQGSSTSNSATASFVCYAPVAAGSFTVPSYIALGLPAASGGTLGVANSTTPGSFNASGLTAPGVFFGDISYSISATYK